MTQKVMIVWMIVALVAGLVLGFGLRSQIASLLNLNAQTVTGTKDSDIYSQSNSIQKCMKDKGYEWPGKGTPKTGFDDAERDCKNKVLTAAGIIFSDSLLTTKQAVALDACAAGRTYFDWQLPQNYDWSYCYITLKHSSNWN